MRRSEDDDGALCGGCGHFSGIGNLLRGRAETTREFLSVLLRGTVNGGEVGTFILSIRIALAGLESARIEDTRQVFGDPDAAQTPSHTAQKLDYLGRWRLTQYEHATVLSLQQRDGARYPA